MRKTIIAPSLLAADFRNLHAEVLRLEKAGVRYLHHDVMDGHFVPNLSYGSLVVKALSQAFKMVHDVHLMIENPQRYFQDFVNAGASMITFHYEVGKDLTTIQHWIQQLHQFGVKAGIAIKPATPVEVVFPLLEQVDLILIMSVEPGFGGQPFMANALAKIQTLRSRIDQGSYRPLISVDGGINDVTGQACRLAGVDILVAGSYLMGHADLTTRLQRLNHE